MITKEQRATWREQFAYAMQSSVGEYCPPEFIQVLDAYDELELALYAANALIGQSADEAKVLSDRADRAEKDSARLDWIQQKAATISIGMRDGCKCGSCQAWNVEPEKGAPGQDEFSLRDAIDKAMEAK